MTESAWAIVTATDVRFALGAAVTIHSSLEHLARDCAPEIFVLDDGLAPESRARMPATVESARPDVRLHVLPVPRGRIEGLTGNTRLSDTTYARLLIPELLPSGITRALWLDADVLVRHDVSPLFALDLGGAPVGAARDASIASVFHELSGVRNPGEERPYLNAGVLVIDIPAWRQARVSERAFRYAVEAGPLRWAEQDALNAILESWYEIDPRWNCQHAHGLPKARFDNASVWHFIGGKPWNPQSDTPGTGAWLRALARSSWFSRAEMFRWFAAWLGLRVALDDSGHPRWRGGARHARRAERR